SASRGATRGGGALPHHANSLRCCHCLGGGGSRGGSGGGENARLQPRAHPRLRLLGRRSLAALGVEQQRQVVWQRVLLVHGAALLAGDSACAFSLRTAAAKSCRARRS